MPMEKKSPAEQAIGLIGKEYARVCGVNCVFGSAHDGLAHIIGEVDELKAAVLKNRDCMDIEKMRTEAVQIGAMAMRFVVDVCHGEGK